MPLTLLCAMALAAADASTRRWLSHLAASELVLVRFAVSGLLLSPLLLLQPWPALPTPFWLWVAGLVPLELAAMWLYMHAIRSAPLSRTLPYLAFTPVITVATGWLLLGERVGAGGLAGIALVAAGAWLLNAQHARGAGLAAVLDPLRAMLTSPGPRWMLGVAALYSVTSVMGKGALQYVEPGFFAPFYFGLLGLVVLVPFLLARRGRIPALGRRPGSVLLVGGLFALMVYTHFLAIEMVEVAYMISVKRSSLLFGIILGALWLGERNLRRNLLAGGLMVVGVAFVSVSRSLS